MKVLILGSEGYIGTQLQDYLRFWDSSLTVHCMDSYVKDELIRGFFIGNHDCIVCKETIRFNIASRWAKKYLSTIPYVDVIIDLAEYASAPYSQRPENMFSVLENNVLGTINVALASVQYEKMPHIIKLGTMGEYGTQETKIPEGNEAIKYPKMPGSLYHASKVADSIILEQLCRTKGLKVTDINQGPVYGFGTSVRPWNEYFDRVYVDSDWGTVVNRMLVQDACDIPVTVYGKGRHKRGFLSLEDACSAIYTVIQHPPKEGEFRVINQIHEIFSIEEIANMINPTVISYVDNPRIEKDDHTYEVEANWLKDHGWKPSNLRDMIPYYKKMLSFMPEAQKEAVKKYLLNETYYKW